MVILEFKNGTDWYKANWAFRQLCADVRELSPDDKELHHELELGQAFGLINFSELEPNKAQKIIAAMEVAAIAVVEGKLKGVLKVRPNDLDGQRMYLESMHELLDRINENA